MEAAEAAVSKARGSAGTVSDSQEFKDFVAQERKSLSNVVRLSQIAEKLNNCLLVVLWRRNLRCSSLCLAFCYFFQVTAARKAVADAVSRAEVE